MPPAFRRRWRSSTACRPDIADPVPHSRILRDWLLACDADVEPLRDFLARGESHRLGRYAEQLLHFALLHSPRFDLLAAGLQVRDARRGNMTLGECDFLLARRADRQLLHWELAVKLYLFVPPATPSSGLDERAVQFHWLGPNLADSLADKVARLLDHQLRLTTLDAALSALPIAGPWLPQVYLKGWLFHPLAHGGQLPAVASEAHGRGWWATLDEWWAHAQSTHRAPSAARERTWALLPRARWLAPARVSDSSALSLAAMHTRIETHWRERGAEPLLVVSLNRRAGAARPASHRGIERTGRRGRASRAGAECRRRRAVDLSRRIARTASIQRIQPVSASLRHPLDQTAWK